MRFSYQKLLVDDSRRKVHVTYRPLVPVRVSAKTRNILTYGLIDSGADICLFDSSLCSRLGLLLKEGKKQELQGVGHGRVTFYLHTVTLQIAGCQVETKVGFARNVSHIPFAILGQDGFFDHFLVAFNYPAKWFEVIRSKKRF